MQRKCDHLAAWELHLTQITANIFCIGGKILGVTSTSLLLSWIMTKQTISRCSTEVMLIENNISPAECISYTLSPSLQSKIPLTMASNNR